MLVISVYSCYNIGSVLFIAIVRRSRVNATDDIGSMKAFEGVKVHIGEVERMALTVATGLYLRGYLRFPIPDKIEVTRESNYSHYEPPRVDLWVRASNRCPHEYGHDAQVLDFWMESNNDSAFYVISAVVYCESLSDSHPARISKFVWHTEDAKLETWPSRLNPSHPLDESYHIGREIGQAYDPKRKRIISAPFMVHPLREARSSLVVFDGRFRPKRTWKRIHVFDEAHRALPLTDRGDRAFEKYREWIQKRWTGRRLHPEREKFFRIGYDTMTHEVLVDLRRA
jgi:hypothetical protein